jgi:hypothetical protein
VDTAWYHEGGVLPPAPVGGPDCVRAWEPWVVEEPDGTFRMWYSGHDRTTARILEAEQRPGEAWRRLGTAVDPGGGGQEASVPSRLGASTIGTGRSPDRLRDCRS